MTTETTLYLNVMLEGDLVKEFEVAKEKSGIRSNTEFLRFLIKAAVSTSENV